MNEKTHSGNAQSASPAAFTSERLRNMVLDHLIENMSLMIPGQQPTDLADHFTRVLDSLTTMAHKIASESLANRTHLSPINTFNGTIKANPDDALSDNQRYELRYRLIEQIGDEKPYKDSVLSLEQAQEIYGNSFVDTYWGKLGEHCPHKITTPGNKTLWFTTVRLPAAEQNLESAQGDRATAKNTPPTLR